MPQLRIRRTEWADVLTCTLLSEESVDLNLLRELQSGTYDIFISPRLNSTTDQTVLTYPLTGLTSLSQIADISNLKLTDWLYLLYAIASQIANIEKYHGLLIDPDYIFMYGTPGADLDFQHPQMICLPLSGSTAPYFSHQYEAGILSFLAEPCIRLATADDRLDHTLSDKLLLSAHEKPAEFAVILRDCLFVLNHDDRTRSTVRESENPPAGLVTRSPQNEPTRRQKAAPNKGLAESCHDQKSLSETTGGQREITVKSRNHRISFVLVVQVLFLLIVGAASYLELLTNDFNRWFVLFVLGGFILLDAYLLASGNSPLRRRLTQQQKNAERMKTEDKERNFRTRQQIRRSRLAKLSISNDKESILCQPPARLTAIELAYLDAGETLTNPKTDFQTVNIIRPVFTIGSDPVRSDLCLNSPEIRPIHAIIEHGDTGYRVRDTGAESVNDNKKEPNPDSGVWLNGIRLPDGADEPLPAGTYLRVGRYIYLFDTDSGV